MPQFSRMRNSGVFAAIAVVLVLSIGGGVSAQDATTGSATATVTTILSITATQALAFGTVYQGVAKSVSENVTASSGIFTITGQALAGVSLYAQMPEYMATATGDDRMVVAFSTTDAKYDSTANADPAVNSGGALTNINPFAIPSTTVIGGLGGSHLFLGGRVLPSPNQKAGAYTADIIITVSYIGT
jgi:hypothetical protein